MKKLILLTLLMAYCLTACGDKKGDAQTDTQAVGNQTPAVEQTTEKVMMQDSLADQVDTYVLNNTEQISSEEVDTTTEEIADSIGEFEKKDDTVYATTNVVVRNKPSKDGAPVKNLLKGESVHRVGDNGSWTKIELNGYYYYIASQYLSEEQPR